MQFVDTSRIPRRAQGGLAISPGGLEQFRIAGLIRDPMFARSGNSPSASVRGRAVWRLDNAAATQGAPRKSTARPSRTVTARRCPVQMQWPGHGREAGAPLIPAADAQFIDHDGWPVGAVPAVRPGARSRPAAVPTASPCTFNVGGHTAAFRDRAGSVLNPFQSEGAAQVPLSGKDLMASGARSGARVSRQAGGEGRFRRSSPAARFSSDPRIAGCRMSSAAAARAWARPGSMPISPARSGALRAVRAACAARARRPACLMPSVDRVGRYFRADDRRAPGEWRAIFRPCRSPRPPGSGKAEELVRSALADGFDFGAFDAQVAALGAPAAAGIGAELPRS